MAEEPFASDRVTNGELYRLVRGIREDLNRLVTADRYLAEQKAQDDRMRDLSQELGELQEARRWSQRFAISALVVGFVMPALVLLLTLYVTAGAR